MVPAHAFTPGANIFQVIAPPDDAGGIPAGANLAFSTAAWLGGSISVFSLSPDYQEVVPGQPENWNGAKSDPAQVGAFQPGVARARGMRSKSSPDYFAFFNNSSIASPIALPMRLNQIALPR